MPTRASARNGARTRGASPRGAGRSWTPTGRSCGPPIAAPRFVATTTRACSAALPVDSDWPSQARALAADGRLREAFVVGGARRGGDGRPRGAGAISGRTRRAADGGPRGAMGRGAVAVDRHDRRRSFWMLWSAAPTRRPPSARSRRCCPGSHAAASDLVEASLLLAPERRMTHLTRALAALSARRSRGRARRRGRRSRVNRRRPPSPSGRTPPSCSVASTAGPGKRRSRPIPS